jgi:hypothetical protein
MSDTAHVRAVALLLVGTGCSRLLGLDPPALRSDAALDDARGDVAPDVHIDALVTIAIRQGVDGYGDAHDTYLDAGSPGAARDGDNQVRWRDGARYALIWFDQIITDARVPRGATIVSASLELIVDQSNTVGSVSEVNIAWTDGVTFSTFGPSGGIDPGDIGTSVGTITDSLGLHVVDVTASLAAWSIDPTKNHGWIIAGNGGTDSSARSSESGVITERPRLIVTYAQ